VADLAQLTMWLPPGCPLWISVGGPLAWSTDQRVLNTIEFRLRILDWRKTKSRTKPLPAADPPYAHERAQQDAVIRRKADAYLRRQRKKAKPEGD
jgi:hypothetical protein